MKIVGPCLNFKLTLFRAGLTCEICQCIGNQPLMRFRRCFGSLLRLKAEPTLVRRLGLRPVRRNRLGRGFLEISFLDGVKTEISTEEAVVHLGGSAPSLCAPEIEGGAGLEELARLINQVYGASLKFTGGARAAARYAIECAVVCGHYLRMAKARLPHGQFLGWVRRNTEIQPRTAQNYMDLHKWVSQHQQDILERKPHGLRQLYILAGILPEDGAKTLPREKPDELSKLRKLVRRTCLETAVHIGYSPSADILKALQPLAALLEEVGQEKTDAKAKHISPFDDPHDH